MAAKKLHVVGNDPSVTTPAPPEHLGAAGRDLWLSIQNQYEITDAGGCALLQQAAEAADRVRECRELIAEQGAVMRTKTGAKAHPLLATERDARAALLRAVRYLGLDIEPLRDKPGRPPGG